MNDKILREIRVLKVYSFTLTIVLIAVIVMSFTRGSQKQAFTEIDVERINVIEKDGTLKMVISNQERQHPGMMDGKMLPARQREAGMIFFNTEGDECGGLVTMAISAAAGWHFRSISTRTTRLCNLTTTKVSAQGNGSGLTA